MTQAVSAHRAVAACVLWCASLATSATAHEFWLEPTRTAVAAGGRVGVYLCHGDGYDGHSLSRNPQRIIEFVVHGPDGVQPIVGRDGSNPAGFVRFEREGSHVLAYVSRRAMSVLPPVKFEQHLEEKGLDRALDLHKAQLPDAMPVRESFSRYAKLLLAVGDSANAVDARLGLPLEIVAAPASGSDTDAVRSFQVLYRDQPLGEALVTATRLGTADAEFSARTGTDGRVRFRLDQAGFWRIAVVHIGRPPSRVDADWDSLWASLTFEYTSAGQASFLPWTQRGTHCRNRLHGQNSQTTPIEGTMGRESTAETSR